MAGEKEGKVEVSSSEIEINVKPKNNFLKNRFFILCDKCEGFIKQMLAQYPIVSKIIMGIITLFIFFLTVMAAVN